jgi:predicted pyridoxine 5'-phosphate oxidase superfamily flavin-nucleotide-binding protein
VREQAARGARGIREEMPDQHRALFEKLPYLIVGAVEEGRPWATFLVGMPGFVHTPDARTLVVGATPRPGDPIGPALCAGAPVGVLGIELATRRRNRANGRIRSRDAAGFVVDVAESFGNCPQYIQARAPLGAFERGPVRVERGRAPTDAARAIVARADTAFLASADSESGRVDVSHRGGRPGFLRMEDSTIVLPDYPGNNFFMTLGNLEQNPRAGLAIVDFATGALLSLSGTTETRWTPGGDTEREVRITIEEVVLLENAIPFTWSGVSFARQL